MSKLPTCNITKVHYYQIVYYVTELRITEQTYYQTDLLPNDKLPNCVLPNWTITNVYYRMYYSLSKRLKHENETSSVHIQILSIKFKA